MGRAATCAAGCSEHRLDLVRADALDALAELALMSAERLAALAPLARRLAEGPPPEGVEAAYRRLRDDARRALGATRLPAEEPPEVVTGWWCAECGNVDLPQPCLGVCVWVPVHWICADLYARERATVIADIEAAAAAEALLALVAAVTPRPGRWAEAWRALARRARAGAAP